jgi:hypothetical protein
MSPALMWCLGLIGISVLILGIAVIIGVSGSGIRDEMCLMLHIGCEEPHPSFSSTSTPALPASEPPHPSAAHTESPQEHPKKAVSRDQETASGALDEGMQVLYFIRDALATYKPCEAAVEIVQTAAQQGNFVAMFDTSRAAISPCRSAQKAFAKLQLRLSTTTVSSKTQRHLSQACNEFAAGCKIRADAFVHIARERSVASIKVATGLVQTADGHLVKAAVHLNDAKVAAGWPPSDLP